MVLTGELLGPLAAFVFLTGELLGMMESQPSHCSSASQQQLYTNGISFVTNTESNQTLGMDKSRKGSTSTTDAI